MLETVRRQETDRPKGKAGRDSGKFCLCSAITNGAAWPTEGDRTMENSS
jgi:hypothetical protein